jgi:hypothetical protein
MNYPLHLFKAGTHTDRYGREYVFSPDAVREMAQVYNPAKYQAPLQIDHEGRLIGGYLREAATVGEHLVGVPSDISPSFAKAASGRQISLQLFTPEASDNPTPGAWGIAHVALVKEGAIKLLPPAFSVDDPQHPVFFEAPQFSLSPDQLLRFLELLKELLAGGMPPEQVEAVLPEPEMQAAAAGDEEAQQAIASALVEEMPSYSKPLTTVERELLDAKRRLRCLEIENDLDRRVFAKGKLPPRFRSGLSKFLSYLPAAPVEFEAGRQQSPYDFVMDILDGLPVVLPGGEVAPQSSAPQFISPKVDPSNPQYESPMADEIRQFQKQCAQSGKHISFTEAKKQLLQKKGG